MNKLLLTLRKNLFVTPPAYTFSVVRSFLSSIYAAPTHVDEIIAPFPGCDEMALQIIPIDRCYERDLPVSSMMMDKLVRSIVNKDHARGALYYFHKFRHSLNGYYLHPWSIFTFVSKCLQTDATILLDALNEKNQFGVFPDTRTMNLILDHFLEADDIESAVKIAGEMFLLETLDNQIAQVLAIFTMSKFWKRNCSEDKVLPDFSDLSTKRNVAAVFLVVGVYTSNASLLIIGNSMLGNIEAEHGIRAIYQDPWGPLSTEPGYLKRAVEILNTTQTPVSQQCVDILLQCSAGQDDVTGLAEKAIDKLKGNNLIESDEKLSMDGIADEMMKKLPLLEDEEQGKFINNLQSWKAERDLLEELEKELCDEFKAAREAHFREKEIKIKAHAMAVETLGFWDLAENRKNEERKETKEKTIYFLRKDYVDGSIDDLELIERFRERRGIIDNALIWLKKKENEREMVKNMN